MLTVRKQSSLDFVIFFGIFGALCVTAGIMIVRFVFWDWEMGTFDIRLIVGGGIVSAVGTALYSWLTPL